LRLGNTSPVVTQVVKLATSMSLTSSRNPARRNQNVTFTAVVAPVAAAGQVEFYDGAVLLSTRTLSGSGRATLSVSGWTVGSHTVTVRYLGNNTYAPSVSAPVTQVINQ
jgi:hypothetical protein